MLLSVLGFSALLGLSNPSDVQASPLTTTAAASSTTTHQLPDMAERAKACTGCHGPEGVATAEGFFPRIAGKPAGYLFNQLRHFRDHTRRFKGMNHLVENLSDDYLHAFADYFAALELPYPEPARQKLSQAERDRAQKLVREGDAALQVPACASCHGDSLTGVRPAVPGLLGLPRDYLAAQMGAWRNDLRHAQAPDCMATIAHRLAPTDVAALAGWLASQPVVNGGKPASGASIDHANAQLECGSITADGQLALVPVKVTEPAQNEVVRRGWYLSQLGNCAGCHTDVTGPELAGGVPIRTPFGRVYGPNITPDAQHGIGNWSEADFKRAMRDGVAPDSSVLNPVFPYQFYQGLTDADLSSLHAWLQTVAPAATASRGHDLEFPYGSQLALKSWRWLFVDEPANKGQATSAATPSVEQGAYLVDNLLHCAACHGARNWAGGFSEDDHSGGQLLAEGAGYAPSLSHPDEIGLGQWSVAEIKEFLLKGSNPHAEASGLMAKVVQHSTQYLSDQDATSAAMYLQATAKAGAGAKPLVANRGEAPIALYKEHCADCHGEAGEGRADLAPPLAGRASLGFAAPDNTIAMILYGGFGAVTESRPYPPGMPGFAHRLSDAEVAELAGFIRQAWGNTGSSVTSVQVQKLR